MPGREFYKGNSMADALRMMAEHHAAEETRHISNFEFELLHEAANLIEDLGLMEKDHTSSVNQD